MTFNRAATASEARSGSRSHIAAGQIPHLRVGKRYRFTLDRVLRSLAARAAASGVEVPNVQ